jgi:hypothetical protein
LNASVLLKSVGGGAGLDDEKLRIVMESCRGLLQAAV